jgi:drug/metabolite transporter (DMT)-like permease
LYDEQLQGIDLLGIGLAIIAVVMSVYKGEKGIQLSPMRIVLPLILFIGSGVVDSSIKYAQHTVLTDESSVRFTSSVFLFAGFYGTIVLLIRNISQKRSLSYRDVLGGIGLGIPNFGSIYFLILVLSLPNWPSSQLFPLNHVGVVLASAITGVLLFREKLNKFNRIGLVLAIIAIFIISYF